MTFFVAVCAAKSLSSLWTEQFGPLDSCLWYCDVQDAEKAAKKLTDEAYGRGSNDNISCIVLCFRF